MGLFDDFFDVVERSTRSVKKLVRSVSLVRLGRFGGKPRIIRTKIVGVADDQDGSIFGAENGMDVEQDLGGRVDDRHLMGNGGGRGRGRRGGRRGGGGFP
jgi:hypothetical protein